MVACCDVIAILGTGGSVIENRFRYNAKRAVRLMDNDCGALPAF